MDGTRSVATAGELMSAVRPLMAQVSGLDTTGPDVDLVRRVLERAIERGTTAPEAFRFLASIYLMQKDSAGAARVLEQALKAGVTPGSPRRTSSS